MAGQGRLRIVDFLLTVLICAKPLNKLLANLVGNVLTTSLPKRVLGFASLNSVRVVGLMRRWLIATFTDEDHYPSAWSVIK